MFYLNNKLKEYGNIDVCVVGCGIMGTSLVTQLNGLYNLTPRVLCSRRIDKVVEAFNKAGIFKNRIKVVNDLYRAKFLIKEGYYIATTNYDIATKTCDVIVDCTGDTELGTKLALKAIKNGCDVVSLNVEMDATVGPYLNVMAKNRGVVYSGSAGDEPGAIMELYEFLKTSGFEILVLGKGKNNKLDNYATPKSLENEAISRGISPRMLTSFVDGTNTMIELCAVCNATGFKPDVRGCHFFETTKENLAKDICLKKEGGVLNSYGVVEFAKGVAPGVFAIVRSENDIICDEMKYLSMGDGPNFSIYRPYHLTSIETPISIIRAVVLRDSTIAPIGEPIAEVITIAKRDIKKGESIYGIGGDCVFGALEDVKIQKKENLLPIGLITGEVIALKDIKKGKALTYDDVSLDKNSTIVKLRQVQDRYFN